MSQRYIGGLIYNPPGGFSGYFDGSGDYLSVPDNAVFDLGSGAFTLEAWILPFDVTPSKAEWIMSQWLSDTNNSWGFRIETSGALNFYYSADGVNSATIGSSAPGIAENQWNHIAVVRNSNTVTIYVNGSSVASGTVSVTLYNSSTTVMIGNQSATGFGQTFTGYISNARVVKGTAVYTSAFTPPVGPLQAITNTSLLTCAYPTFRDGSSNNFTITVNGNTAVSTQNPFPQTQLPNPALGNQGNGVYSMSQYQALRSQNLWPAIDPYFDFVTLMLHGNGTNGAQNNTFLDSSTNNFTITRNGNTTQGTFTPYGANWSNYFDGTGDFLTAPDNAAFNLSGDFTIEAWVNVANISSEYCVFHNHTSNSNGVALTINSGAPRMLAGNGSWYILTNSSITIAANTWNHIAYTRSGSTWTIWVNGVSGGTATSSTTPTYSGGVQIGQLTSGVPLFFPGYISNLRVLKGTALYTSNFTPPTAPLTAITNTSLLTCADNRFIDDSTNNFTITRNGDVSVQRFSPFNPTTPYAAGTIGGSGYFDGSGDFLTFATNTAFSFGTGDFTIEFWTYTGDNSIIGGYSRNPLTIGEINFYIRIAAYHGGTDGSIVPYNVQTAANILSSTVVIKDNAWHHIAFVRESGTAKLWVDGIYQGSAALSTNFSNTNTNAIGALNSSGLGPYNGYVSNVRVVKGTAVYTGTSNITIPTSPLTAISGTSVLTNFTNAGIIDNAMMNDLETVGNAQISTSVSKFGGGSLAFDGSGDYLLIPNGENFNFGSGSWTIEFWVRFNTVGVRQVILSSGNGSGTNAPFFFELNNSLRLRFLIQTAATGQIFVDTTYTPNANQWYHLAGVRNGSTATFYVDGVSVGSVSPGTNALTAITNQIVIGDYIGLGIPLNGYLDDVRFTKGIARYTANFTPQRSQWQDQ